MTGIKQLHQIPFPLKFGWGGFFKNNQIKLCLYIDRNYTLISTSMVFSSLEVCILKLHSNESFRKITMLGSCRKVKKKVKN